MDAGIEWTRGGGPYLPRAPFHGGTPSSLHEDCEVLVLLLISADPAADLIDLPIEREGAGQLASQDWGSKSEDGQAERP